MSKQNYYANRILSCWYHEPDYESNTDAVSILKELLHECIKKSSHHSKLCAQLLNLTLEDKEQINHIINYLNTDSSLKDVVFEPSGDFAGMMKAFFAYYPEYYTLLNDKLKKTFKTENPLPHYIEYESKRLKALTKNKPKAEGIPFLDEIHLQKYSVDTESKNLIEKYYPLPSNHFITSLFSSNNPNRDKKLSGLYAQETDSKSVIEDVLTEVKSTTDTDDNSRYFIDYYNKIYDETLDKKELSKLITLIQKSLTDVKNDIQIAKESDYRLMQMEMEGMQICYSGDPIAYRIARDKKFHINTLMGIGLLGLILNKKKSQLSEIEKNDILKSLNEYLRHEMTPIKLFAHFALTEAGESGLSEETLKLVPDAFRSAIDIDYKILSPFFHSMDTLSVIRNSTKYGSTDKRALAYGLFKLHSSEIKQQLMEKVDEGTNLQLPKELRLIITKQLGM